MSLEILSQKIKESNGTDLLPAFNNFFTQVGKMDLNQVVALYHTASMFDQHTDMAVTKMAEQIKSALKQRMCALISEHKKWIADKSDAPTLYASSIKKWESNVESMKLQFQSLTNDQIFSKF